MRSMGLSENDLTADDCTPSRAVAGRGEAIRDGLWLSRATAVLKDGATDDEGRRRPAREERLWAFVVGQGVAQPTRGRPRPGELLALMCGAGRSLGLSARGPGVRTLGAPRSTGTRAFCGRSKGGTQSVSSAVRYPTSGLDEAWLHSFWARDGTPQPQSYGDR